MTFEELVAKVRELSKKVDTNGVGFLAVLIDGKLDPVAAFTLGKLKVDGDIGKALEFANVVKSARA